MKFLKRNLAGLKINLGDIKACVQSVPNKNVNIVRRDLMDFNEVLCDLSRDLPHLTKYKSELPSTSLVDKRKFSENTPLVNKPDIFRSRTPVKNAHIIHNVDAVGETIMHEERNPSPERTSPGHLFSDRMKI